MQTSLTSLLGNSTIGAIYLDRKGSVIEVNDCARKILQRGDGVRVRNGSLRGRTKVDDARIGQLLEHVLPRFGEVPVSGSVALEQSPGIPRLVLHAVPVTSNRWDFGIRRAIALVLVVDPRRKPHINRELVAEALNLTPSESQVAAALAVGHSVREVAESTRRKESSVRWLIKEMHAKLGISRQSDLVRMVLAVDPPTSPRH